MDFWPLIIGLCLAIISMRCAFAKLTRSDLDMFYEMADDLPLDGCDLLLVNSPFQGNQMLSANSCH